MRSFLYHSVFVFIGICSEAFGQDWRCLNSESYPSSLERNHTEVTTHTQVDTSETFGPQDLVLLFVDYPDGRIQPGNILPTTDADTMYFHNIGNDSVFDAIGGMGTVHTDPDDPQSPMRKKIRKYTYDDYWDMYFSVGTYNGSVHPDYASHGIEAYGSFREYYREVSYGKMDIVPFQTKSGEADKYHTGIVNAIDEVNGKKYVRWIMMPMRKGSYTVNGVVMPPINGLDIEPVLEELYQKGEISFDVNSYKGKVIIVGAGSSSGGIYNWGKYIAVREKRWSNFDNRSTLDGIWVSVHEYGHTLQFGHLASGSYDPMNVTFSNRWTRYLYCPPHCNPIFKLQAGWIAPQDVIRIRSDSSVWLPPIDKSSKIATYTVYGDALRNGVIDHSEYFVVEYRKREGFNRFCGGQDTSSFTGGALVWHYSSFNRIIFDPDDQGSNIGLTVAGYCDSNNHSNFSQNSGTPSDFYYADHNRIDSSTNPNTSSTFHLPTGIALSEFSVSGDSMKIVDTYTLGPVPEYTGFFIYGFTFPSRLSGTIFIENGDAPNHLTILDHTRIDIMGRDVQINPNDYFYARASSQSSITIRGAGFGKYRLPWGGMHIHGSDVILENCTIADVVNDAGIEITMSRYGHRYGLNIAENQFVNCNTGIKLHTYENGLYPAITGNNFEQCATDIWLEGADRIPIELGGFDNNNFHNLVITGSWKLTDAKLFTIPANATAHFWGSIIQLDTGASIYSYGKLLTNDHPNPDTYQTPSTFTSTGGTSVRWGSIVLNGPGASHSVLDNIAMHYGTTIQVINGASNVVIKNSTFASNKGGISFNNASGSVLDNQINSSGDFPAVTVQNGSTVICNGNVIKKVNGYRLNTGIYFCGGSNGTLWQNDIEYFNWGVAAAWGSSPFFYNPQYSGDNRNNRITNCQYGIMVYQNSYPEIGNADAAQYGVSTIEDNAVDIALNTYYNTTSDLHAANIYWNNGNAGDADFRIGTGSSIVTTPSSAINYWSENSQQSFPPPSETKSQVLTSVTTSGSDSLFDGIQLRLSSKYKEAADFFTAYLADHPENQRAYVELYNCCSDQTAGQITKYFENLPQAAVKEQALLLSYLYLKQGNVIGAKEINNHIIDQYAHTPLAAMAKLGNFYSALYSKNDPEAALLVLDDIASEQYLLTTPELALAQTAMNEYVDPQTGSMPYADNGEKYPLVIPTQSGLIGNYPNPFNTISVIVYQMSSFSKVTLKVYDILGREMATLVDGMKEEGFHTVSFDGSRISSGVYFIRFVTQDQQGFKIEQTSKILLIK